MRGLLTVLSISIVLLTGVVFPVYAAEIPLLDPNFQIVPDASVFDSRCPEGAPLSYGGVLQVIQNVINTGVSIGVIAMVLVIAYAGFTFMVNPTNPEARTKARSMFTNVIVGMIILLAAWLVVDFIMKTLYNSSSYGPWNEILAPASNDSWCIRETVQQRIPGILGNIAGGLTQGTGGVSSGPVGNVTVTGGAGSCTVPRSGPCSVGNLQATFGAAASQAAQICTAESSGNPQNLSRSDVLGDGSAYSVGLFQINLTNSFSYRVNGRNCSEAFSGPCQGRAVVQSGSGVGRCSATIRDTALYRACVSAAQNPTINIQAARTLYDGDWGRWSTARTCNLPRG